MENNIFVILARNNYYLAKRTGCDFCPIIKSCSVKEYKKVTVYNKEEELFFIPPEEDKCTEALYNELKMETHK